MQFDLLQACKEYCKERKRRMKTTDAHNILYFTFYLTP